MGAGPSRDGDKSIGERAGQAHDEQSGEDNKDNENEMTGDG